MDDAMIDLMAGEGMLRGRLEAYGESRLSPSLAATTRMRARVLAVAHRQANLIRADGALAVVDPAVTPTGRPAMDVESPRVGSRPPDATRRAGSVLLAACLGLTIAVGTTMAAQPGGALYGARVWAETLALPMAPRERVVAELARLQARLLEVQGAATRGDADAATSALLAYEGILGAATDDALQSDDPVALAALEAGVHHNVEVLEALLVQVPATATPAIERALERAVERSESSVDHIKDRPGRGGAAPGGDGSGDGPTASPTTEPAATPAPTKTSRPQATPAPTKTPRPAATPAPTKTPRPEATPRATRTPRATVAPKPGTSADPTPRPERTPRGSDPKATPTP